ncbi:MAG: amino acid ABC transporter permease [Caldilineaceae bacterium]|nr:amino acid ABC transporter permease [Caldilineaceae bacterium]
MTMATGSADAYDLTNPADQKAFARQLVAQKRRRAFWHSAQIALVWALMFGLMAIGLSILNVDFAYVFANTNFVLLGLGFTIGISLASILIASAIALVGALMRLSSSAVAQGLSGFYVSLFRGTPLLIQIYIIYLGLPQIGQQLTNLGYPQIGGLFVLTAIQSGILALSLNYGAYMTEIFRAGIQSVAQGQWQAAQALGMKRLQTLRLVILPQAVRIIIPAIGNQFIAMQKDSSLVSIVGIWEITYRASRFARKDSKFMEMFLLAAAIYWVLTILSEWIQGRLEARMAASEKRA